MVAVKERLQQCIDTLEEIKKSGYWPFVSPAPCSTECRIKDGINDALNGLYRAKANHELMFDRTGRDPMKCVSFKIVERGNIREN